MYISAPSGTKVLAGYLIPEEEYARLDHSDFNTYGEEKSLEIIQFMRDLDWVYISFDEGDRISLRPTEKGLRIFEDGFQRTCNVDCDRLGMVQVQGSCIAFIKLQWKKRSEKWKRISQ